MFRGIPALREPLRRSRSLYLLHLSLLEYSTQYIPCRSIPVCHDGHGDVETYPRGFWSQDVMSPLHVSRDHLRQKVPWNRCR